MRVSPRVHRRYSIQVLSVGAVLLLGLSGVACVGSEPAASHEGGANGDGGREGTGAELTQPAAQEPPAGTTSQKPVLSEKVRQVLAETDDNALAYNELMLLYPTLKDYAVDEATILGVVRETLAAGDDHRAEIVVTFLQLASQEVNGKVGADVFATYGDINLAKGDEEGALEKYELALQADPDHAYSREKVGALGGQPEAGPVAAVPESGEAAYPEIERRDDLARFRFRYADVEDGSRILGISETCYDSGVLRAVPLWDAGAMPWVFMSVAEGSFVQVNPPAGAAPVRLDFEFDRSDAAWAVAVSGPFEGRFEEAGYNPEGFEPSRGECD